MPPRWSWMMLGGLWAGCGAPEVTSEPVTSLRVPAEWEPQEAVWLQWPRRYEQGYEPAFAKIVSTIVQYENVHLLVHDAPTAAAARTALATHGELSAAIIGGAASPSGFSITWHDTPNNNAWMRDNGPRYVVTDGRLRVQNWRFDGWGGGFGPIPVAHDNVVPDAVANYLGLPVDRVDVVHERGDLEFNGRDALIANWSVIGDPQRNPGMTRTRAIEVFEQRFGVSRVVLLEGVPTGDATGGHVDGIARFIDADTVVVADCSETSACRPGGHDDRIYDASADSLASAGFEVVRFPFLAAVPYRDAVFDTDYMNWLVGNGFVITVGFGHAAADADATERLETWFPGRDVYVIEMLESWYAGGGVHCHTNDRPRIPAAAD